VSQLHRGRIDLDRASSALEFEDAQARCHLKAFLFEQAVAFWATTTFRGSGASKSGVRSPEQLARCRISR
jgi:hypothetical protein